MKLRLTAPALRQLTRVLAFIDEQNPRGARHVQGRLAEIMKVLLAHPFAGAETAIGRRRVLASPYPYAVTYRVGDDEIIVLGVRHTARRPGRS